MPLLQRLVGQYIAPCFKYFMASQVERMTVIRCAVNAPIIYRIAFGELGVFPDEFSYFWPQAAASPV